MEEVKRLDVARWRDKAAAHEEIARALDLPAYYGRNLDALYDCLWELPPMTVVIENAQAAREKPGYAEKILGVFREVARERADLRLVVEGEK